MRTERSLLDDVMPTWHWRTRRTHWVEAEPEAAFELARRVTVAEVPFTARLRAIGALPGRVAGFEPAAPRPVTLFDDLLEQGFSVLELRPGRELVLGRVGQFWRWGGTIRREVIGRERFDAFGEPGFAKAAISFRAEPADLGSLLAVETRVAATDRTTYRRFNRYWLIGAWANRVTRAQLLRAVAQRARN
ncbi:MAG: hypothetical protein ACKVWR_11305 [Acidimicrobiales bacterium]